MKTFFSCDVHFFTFLISGSVIKSHDPRQCFTVNPFRPGMHLTDCRYVHILPLQYKNIRSQVTVISCLSINVPSPSAGKSLIYS